MKRIINGVTYNTDTSTILAFAEWDDREGKRWWADYTKPREAGVGWEWAHSVVSSGYGKKPICAAMIPVRGVDSLGGPKLGWPKSHVW